MKNELTERREGRVLYEPPEPLFPDLLPRRQLYLRRAATFVALFCLIAFVCVVAISASGGGGEEGTTEPLYGFGAPEAPDMQQTESYSESSSETAEGISTVETETEVEETESPELPVPEFVESDLSFAERGDSYIINYTDRAVEISELLDRGFVDSEVPGGAAPSVMILHTHTSESYLGSTSEYLDGVISVGDALSRKLNSLGLTTLHCTVIHDGGEGNAYIAARETIETMLRVYPSIKYVIDLHRIELELDGLPVKTLSSAGAAQIRLTVSADGEGWQESLSLALSLRQRLNVGDARICMPPTLSPSRYNSDLSPYYLMVDVGATGNTAREAILAAERLAQALCDTILKR